MFLKHEYVRVLIMLDPNIVRRPHENALSLAEPVLILGQRGIPIIWPFARFSV